MYIFNKIAKILVFIIIISFICIGGCLIAMTWMGKPDWLLNIFNTCMIIFMGSLISGFFVCKFCPFN